MFSEILKIIPKLDQGEMSRLERNLSTKFQNVAKKFGGGLKKAIIGGGILGLASGIIDKLLNPLQEVKESIDRALQAADQADTGAGQFNTTSGNLARLQSFGAAKGLDAESVNMLVTKFQSAVAQAAGDPTKTTAVSNFVGQKDTAEAFFSFIQSLQRLQKVDPDAALRAQAEVFGEKQIGKMSEFIQADFQELASKFAAVGAPTTADLTKNIKSLADIEETQAILRAVRAQKDLIAKGSRITPEKMNLLEVGTDKELQKENERIGSTASLAKIQQSSQDLVFLVEKLYLQIAPALASVLPGLAKDIVSTTKAISMSRAARGMISGEDK